jgi:5-methylcytosine-specific restriction endonuclease McrA
MQLVQGDKAAGRVHNKQEQARRAGPVLQTVSSRKRQGISRQAKPGIQAARWKRENTLAKRLRDRVGRHRRLLGGDLTVPQVVAQRAEFDNRCVRCIRHESETGGVLQIDHVVPPPEGANPIANIQPLCRVCNPKKGRKRSDYRPGFPGRMLIAILMSCLNMLPYVPAPSAESNGRKPCLPSPGLATENAA